MKKKKKSDNTLHPDARIRLDRVSWQSKLTLVTAISTHTCFDSLRRAILSTNKAKY